MMNLVKLLIILFIIIQNSYAAFAQNGCVTSECHVDMGKAKFLHGPVAANECKVCHIVGENDLPPDKHDLSYPKEGKSHFAKLADWLRKHELTVDCKNMYPIPWPEAQLLSYVRRQDGENWDGWNELTAYNRLNLGHEAIVTSKHMNLEKWVNHEVQVRQLGQIKSAPDKGGVILHAPDGRIINLPNDYK